MIVLSAHSPKLAPLHLVVVDIEGNQCLYVNGKKRDWYGDGYVFVDEIGDVLGGRAGKIEYVRSESKPLAEWPKRLEDVPLKDKGKLF